jgi:flagellar assembly protein FliH
VNNGNWLLADLGGPVVAAAPVDVSYEAGHADGLRDGVNQAGDQLKPAVAALNGVVRALDSRRAEILGDRQRDLQALALAVARRLVQHDVERDPALLAGWIQRAIELLPHDLQIDVRLHPADLDAITGLRGTVAPADTGVMLHWIADESVGRAGFVVESPQRLVDGRLDVALRALYERFDEE